MAPDFSRGIWLMYLCLLLSPHCGSVFVDDNYLITTEFDISSVSLGSSLSTTAVTAISACAQKCSAHTDCVAAIHDGSNNKCYLWSSLIKVEKSSNSGVSLLHIMCAEQQVAACCYHDESTCGGPVYTDCQDAFDKGDIRNGDIYYLRPHSSWSKTIRAVCEFDSSSGWTIFQRRLDGSVDFYRYWQDYVNGFGSLRGEYWLGLEAVYYLTGDNSTASFYLEDHDGETRTANYTNFHIDDSANNYRLHFDSFYGDATDSLSYQQGHPFTTRDVDNDDSSINCAIRYTGAWWYKTCHNSNLNGIWYEGGDFEVYATGIVWYHWKGHYYSMKTVKLRLSR